MDLSPSLVAGVFEHAHDAIVVFAAGTEEILAVNPRACQLYGLSEQELVGSSLAALTEDVDAGRKAVETIVRHGSLDGFRTRHHRADGSTIWFEMNGALIEHRGIPAVVSIGRDITSQMEAEDHLLQAERDYRMLFDSNPQPMWIYDPATLRFLAVNDAALGQYGFSREEFLQKTIAEIRPDSEIQRLVCDCESRQQVFQESGPWIHARKDGSLLSVQIRSHDITFRGTRARFVQAEDISERLKAERDLHESEARYRCVIENAQDVISIFDENGTILYESPSVERVFGYRADEMVGRSVFDFIHPSDLAEVAQKIGENLAMPHSTAEAEIRFSHKDGSWRTIAATGHNLLMEPAVRGIVINSRDITERREAELALRHSQETLRMAQRAGRIGTWELTFDPPQIACSDENYAVYGREPSSPFVTLERWLEVIHPEDRPVVKAAVTNALQHRTGINVEFRVVWPDGSTHWIVTKGEIRKDTDGTPVSFVGVNIDITLQKETAAALERARDEAVQASKMKSQFLASMSHEIRTPLNGIIGNTGLLLDTGLTREQLEYTQTVRSCSVSLLHLINDLLDLSKVEAGKLCFEKRPIDLRATLDGIREILAAEIARNGLRFTLDIPAEFPLRIVGDAGRIRQIVLNFAANAVKFTDRGSVEIRVAAALGAGEQRFRITVRDTGPGIPEELQERLFHKFVQGDSSITRRHGGTGLGLAISKSLAEAMGGCVGVQSRPGHGSEFWVDLPLEAAEMAECRQAVTPSVSRQIPTFGGNKRALVVEDNLVNQRLAVRLLEKYGVTVDVAGNGAEAVEMWRRFPYDVILMDCQMPEVDGYEATRQIRGLEQGRRTPIVAVTAHVITEEREDCMACGMDGVLGKPVNRTELESLLSAILGGTPAGVGEPHSQPCPRVSL